MQKKYFVFWSDYETGYLDEYTTKEEAEKAAGDIRKLESESYQGTQLHRVIRGSDVAYENIEVVTKIRFL